jgi:hypothetical protein
MKKAVMIVIGVMFAAGLLWSSQSLFAKTPKIPTDHTNYGKLVENPAILNSNPGPCAGVMNPGYLYDIDGHLFHAEQVPDSDAQRSSQIRCKEYRDEQLEKLSSAISETDSPEILARLFLLEGRFQYAKAYDNRSVENAESAVGAFATSLSHASGSIKEGFDEFGRKQREYYERAINLRETLKKEKEQEKNQEKPEVDKAGGESDDEDEGDDLPPILEPGVQP